VVGGGSAVGGSIQIEVIGDFAIIGAGIQDEVGRVCGKRHVDVAHAAPEIEPGMRAALARVAARYKLRGLGKIEKVVFTHVDIAMHGLNTGASIDYSIGNGDIADVATIQVENTIEVIHRDIACLIAYADCVGHGWVGGRTKTGGQRDVQVDAIIVERAR